MAEQYTVSTKLTMVDKLTKPISTITSRLRVMSTAVTKFGNKSNSSFMKAGKSANLFGGAMNQISGLVGVAAFGTLIKGAVDTEDAMLGAAASFGVFNKSSQGFTKIKSAVQGLNSTMLDFSPEQKAQALQKFGLAGFTVQQSVDRMNATLKFSKATQMDLATASDIATDAFSAFGSSVNIGNTPMEKYNAVLNTMLKTTSVANTNLTDLQDAVVKSAPVFSSAGQKMTDLQSAIAILADSGVKGALAGTKLKIAMTNLVAPAAAGSNALKQLGVQTRNSDGTMRPFFKILEDVRVAQKKTSKATFDMALKNIVGKDALGAFLTLLNTSDKTIETKYRKPLETANGTLDNTFKLMGSSMSSSFTRMINSFKQLSAVVVDSDNISVSFFDTIANSVDTFSKFISENTQLVTGFFDIVTSVGKVVAAVYGLKVAMSVVRYSAMITMFTISPLTASFGLLNTGLVKTAKRLGFVKVGMLGVLGPIAVISGALYGVYKLFTANDKGMNKWLFGLKTGLKVVLYPLLKVIEGISFGLNAVGVISDKQYQSVKDFTAGPDFKTLSKKFSDSDVNVQKEIENNIAVANKQRLDINVKTDPGVSTDIVATPGLNMMGIAQ